MKKILTIILLLFFSISFANAKTNIDENLYNSLKKQENYIRDKITDINSDTLKKAINITEEKINSDNSIQRITIYTLFKNVFETELQYRNNTNLNELFPENVLNPNDLDMNTNAKKILIAYYSRTNNTQTIANYIQEATGGDIHRIELIEAYPEDYNEATALARKQINEGIKPALKSSIDNLEDYDTIFLGSPLWRGTIATPVSTFLDSNDFSGKTIIPFITYGSSGISGSVDAIKKLSPNSNILNGKAFSGNGVVGAREEVFGWVDGLEL